MQPDEVLTADEAAALLRVSVQTVLKESREGRLPGVKVGREWRYARSALLRHLSQYPEPVSDIVAGEAEADVRGPEA